MFTSTRSGRVEVHVIELETYNVTQLTGLDGEQGSAAADLSPDGTQIVYEKFISRDFGFSHKNIYVMSANGEDQRPLIPNPPDDADKIVMRFFHAGLQMDSALCFPTARITANNKRVVYLSCVSQVEEL